MQILLHSQLNQYYSTQEEDEQKAAIKISSCNDHLFLLIKNNNLV